MKRKFKQIICIILAGALAAVILGGCGSSGTSADSSSGSSSSSGSLDSILYDVLNEGVLTVGMCLFIEPSSYYDDDGNPVGYDVDIAQLLADSLGVELEIVDLSADARVSSLETGKVDIVLAQFTKTLERAQKIDFSDPYTASGPVVVARTDSGIESIDDLEAGMTIAVTTGSSHDEVVQEEFPDCEYVYYSTTTECVLAVSNGQVDVCVGDANEMATAVADEDDLALLGTIEGYVDYNCIGTVKGDQIWLNYLNEFIFDINSTGTNQELYEKWYGAEMSISLQPEY